MQNYTGPVPYIGTFSRDNIRPFCDGAIILNLDDSTGAGTHWTAFYRTTQPAAAYYCDSYGLVPPREIVEMLPKGQSVIYNTGILQPDNALCGWICVYVLCELGRGASFIDIVTRFDPMPSERNKILIQKYFT